MFPRFASRALATPRIASMPIARLTCASTVLLAAIFSMLSSASRLLRLKGELTVMRRTSIRRCINSTKAASYINSTASSTRVMHTYFNMRPQRTSSFLRFGAAHKLSLVQRPYACISASKEISPSRFFQRPFSTHPSDSHVALYGNGKGSPKAKMEKNTSAKSPSTEGPPKRFSLSLMHEKYLRGEPISMVTCYDYPAAVLCERAGIDLLLVGDSLGMCVLGYDNTTQVTMEEIVHHCRAVRRGAPHRVVIADMPFGSYLTPEDAVRNACRFVKECGADAVKLEGGLRVAPQVSAIRSAGIAVYGHVGLTPQTHAELGGFRVQGTSANAASAILQDAVALGQAGCCAIILECVPGRVSEHITQQLSVPTIGIGAGVGTSGQVQVFHDLVGLFEKFQPKFSKRYTDLSSPIVSALNRYCADVISRRFPSPSHTFRIKSKQLVEFETANSLIRNDETNEKTPVPEDQCETVTPAPISRIAIIGAGAMGSMLVAKLSALEGETAPEIWLLSSWAEHMDAIARQQGIIAQDDSASNTQTTESLIPIDRLICLQSEEGFSRTISDAVDVAIVAVKGRGRETERAGEVAKHILRDEGLAVTIQNGFGNLEIIRTGLGTNHHAVQATVTSGARLETAGTVSLTGHGPTTLCGNSMLDQKGLALCRSLAELLSDAGLQTEFLMNATSSDVDAASAAFQWRKLMANAVINPLTALLDVPNGALPRNPQACNLASEIVKEVRAVMRAYGVPCEDFGDDHDATEFVLGIAQATAPNISSMLADIRRGCDTEIERITGHIVQTGEEVGVPTPINSVVLGLVRAKQEESQKRLRQNCRHQSSSKLQTVHTIADAREVRKNMRGTVGLVPTMGALHDGHLHLIRAAKRKCDNVFVTIFVNPAQFAPGEDFESYPRCLDGDLELLEQEGVDATFAPLSSAVMYPPSCYGTVVDVESIGRGSCEGRARDGFFRGVATICVKLFSVIGPDVAFFGQKDGVQCTVIKQVVRDLNLPLHVEIVPTAREDDGLARSSRNAYLNEKERAAAPIVYRALLRAEEQLRRMIARSGSSDNGVQISAHEIRKAASDRMASDRSSGMMRLQYFSVADNDTAQEVDVVDEEVLRRGVLLSIAVGVHRDADEHHTRLIDCSVYQHCFNDGVQRQGDVADEV